MTRRGLVLAAAAVLVLIALAWAFRPSPLLVEVREVSRGPIEIGFEEEGRTRLVERWLVSAPVAGTLRRVSLREGDPVTAGQTVAEIEPATAALLDPATRSRLAAELAAAHEITRAAESQRRAIEAAAALSRSEASRVAGLHERRLVADSAVEAARAAEARDAAALRAASAELLAARHRARALEAVLADQGLGGGPKVVAIPSPVDGVVVRRLIESASPVSPGTAVIEIGDPRRLEIVVEVLSTQAVSVEAGQPARILRWGGEGELRARVRRVEPGGFTKVSALGVEEQRVRVILDPEGDGVHWSRLADGFRVEVAFVTWRRDDALRVPAAALFRRQGDWYVYVDERGRARERAVGVGRRGPEHAEVLSGLEAGERVVVFPDARLREGVRLAVVGNAT
jgi:HlyD family secretion protein